MILDRHLDPRKKLLLAYVQEELKKFPQARHAQFRAAMDFYDVRSKKIEIIAPQIIGTFNAYSRPTSYGTSRSRIVMRSAVEFLLTEDGLITATEVQQHKEDGEVTANQQWNGYVIPRLGSLVVALREQVFSWPRFIFLHNFGRMNRNRASKLLGFSSTITTNEPFFSRIILERSTDKALEPEMLEEHNISTEIREALLIEGNNA